MKMKCDGCEKEHMEEFVKQIIKLQKKNKNGKCQLGKYLLGEIVKDLLNNKCEITNIARLAKDKVYMEFTYNI